MSVEPPILAIENVTRRFGGVYAVHDVTLAIGRGNVFGLIGPNGAGKTTLLNLIAGALSPTAGQLVYEGADASRISVAGHAKRGIARTFQTVKLFPDMTVLENVMIGTHVRSRAGVFAALLGLSGQGVEERQVRTIAEEMLEFVGITHLAAVLASDLAYGHRRLVEIARALALGPRLLLLDEPAAGLTRTEAHGLVDLIGRINARGTTVILVEHHMDVVFNTCSRLAVLHHGRLLAEGPPAEIRRRPEVVEAYFGSAAAVTA